MSQRLVISMVALILFAGGLAPVFGAEAADSTWTVPRTADGQPDLQGVWANNNAIPLQRPPEWEGKERLTDGELAELEAAAAAATNSGEDALFGDQLVLAAIAREVENQRRDKAGYSASGVAQVAGADCPVSLALDQRT